MIRKALLLLLTVSPLLACSTLEFPGVYRVQIEQGNIVTEEMVSQLEPGMSTSQVEFILGTPLLRDSFSPDRWDYFHMVRKPDNSVEKQRLTVFFENGALSHYESTVTANQDEATDPSEINQPEPAPLEEEAPQELEG